ncbi:hypothetical protein J3R30DRAFT_3695984 [Lentinula aciculospora]|uniref:Uncharacterized protein n=1 Tax=Lentinula aciculospora TaxID=153920 RepID=A0A9W9ASI8_9AGAR|nr:hypothetical protein J3R30DRAFT_3695984 [Lentinula aciculospora]
MSVLTMPNVFVIPPEEDNNPPFCCFDATYPRERYIPTEEDLEVPGSALEIISQQLSNNSPIFHRGSHINRVVMPRRSDGRSIEEVLAGEEEYQDLDITIRGGNPPGDDSEIVEVIKVRRHTQDEREKKPLVSEPVAKSSKSLKARASRAFSSLRSLSRSASRSRIPSQDLPSDTESSRAPSPAPSRRGSMIFSSLFSHSPSLKSRSSFDSFNETPPSPVLAESPSEPLNIQLHTPSSAEMQGFVPYSDADEDGDAEDEMQATPRASRHPPTIRPSSSMSIPKINRRRFSVLNLFSASKDLERSHAGPSIVTSPSISTLQSLSRDSLNPLRTDSTESSSSSGPTTPVDEAFPEPLPSHPSISMLKRLPSFSKTPRKKEAIVIVTEPVVSNTTIAMDVAGEHDLSVGEIRLDSLHFDDLSFDASRF